MDLIEQLKSSRFRYQITNKNCKTFLLTSLETGINSIYIIKTNWSSLQYCRMRAFGGDALEKNAMLHKSSFIIIDEGTSMINHSSEQVGDCQIIWV